MHAIDGHVESPIYKPYSPVRTPHYGGSFYTGGPAHIPDTTPGSNGPARTCCAWREGHVDALSVPFRAASVERSLEQGLGVVVAEMSLL